MLSRDEDRAVRAFQWVRVDDVCPVEFEHLLPLDARTSREDYVDTEPQGRAERCERDSSVSRARVEYFLAVCQSSAFNSRLQHLSSSPVLDRPCRIQVLCLAQQIGRNPLQFDKWCITN